MSIVSYSKVVAVGTSSSSTSLALTKRTTTTTLARVQRNSIFFKFASEGNNVEKVDFLGKEISVGDLKRSIAELRKVPKEDLALSNEATGENFERDGKMLERNLTITVKRTPQLKRKREPRVLHIQNVDSWADWKDPKDVHTLAVKAPIQKRPCPPEYLCKLCGLMFQDPLIARCCGRSACRDCLPKFAPKVDCPLCTKPWEEFMTPVPNKSLADLISKLDMDYFIEPEGRRKYAKTMKIEDVDLLPGATSAATTAAATATSPAAYATA
mmetsp:Transcript_57467/g.125893  ORF Transcript_57467/g.125893 Transcript_57467/m.125893 type:complete len:269 (+) Transcript_57467:82-888(+)